MRKLIVIFISLTMILLSACTDSGGGVTKDQPSPPSPPVVPVIGPIDIIHSSAKILNSSNQQVGEVNIGESFTLIFTAKDSSNQSITGLNISAAKIYGGGADLLLTETSPGVYKITTSISQQINEEFNLKKDNTSINLNLLLNVTYCSPNADITAAPFNSKITYNSELYYVICTPQELVAVNNVAHLSKNFILGKTIDLSSYYVDSNLDNIPDNQFKIGSNVNPYLGKFNAFNTSIKKFKYIGSVSDDYVGLFAKLGSGAEVKNLILDQVSVRGRDNVGSLAGSMENNNSSTLNIDNVTVLNFQDFSTVGNYHGGLSGQIIKTAGLITINNVLVNSSFNLDSSTASRSYVGGVSGFADGLDISNITSNTYVNYTNKNVAVSEVGGISGSITNSTLSNINSISSFNINKGQNIGGVSGSMYNSDFSDSFNNYATIDFNGNISGDLANVGGSFGLIDNSNISSLSVANYTSNTISDSFGLFANQVSNSTILSIGLSGSLDSASNNSSAFIVSLNNSSLTKVRSFGDLNVSGSRSNVAGLVAIADGSSIAQSSFNGTLTATGSSYVSGIVSEISNSVNISDSYVSASITGNINVSGISGKVNPSGVISITRSYTAGSLIGQTQVSGLSIDLSANSSIMDSFSLISIDNGVNILPTNSASIVINKQSLSSVNNTYYLSSETNEAVSCLGADCSNNYSVTDTFTGSANDINYYYSSSNPPMNSWNFSTKWIATGLSLPFLY